MNIVRALALACLVFLPAHAEFHRIDGTKKEVDIETLVVPERHNVFCFYAENNTICRALYADFMKLGSRRLTEFQLIDIGSLTSPTSKKYALTSIPYFVIYDNRGKLVSEGAPAYKQVTNWIAGK